MCGATGAGKVWCSGLLPARSGGRGSGPAAARLPAAAAALVLVLLLPGRGWTDGMYAPAVGEAVANTSDQQAILLFGHDWTRLVLRTGYQGNGQPFSWIVPTWGLLRQEDVTTVDARVFQALDDYTAPQLMTYELGCGTAYGCAGESADAEGSALEGVVTVVDSFRVDGYLIEVVQAEQAQALVQWLQEHDYQVPAQGEEVFGAYVERGFHFVTVRFESPSPTGGGSGGSSGGGSGSGGATGEDLAPALALRFPGTMSTYPLQISALSSNRPCEVLLFTLGRGRYQTVAADFATVEMTLPTSYQGADFSGFYRTQLKARLAEAGGKAFAVEYAGPLSPRQQELFGLAGLREGDDGELFVTRLHARLDPAQMDRDVLLEPVLGEGSTRQHRIRAIAGYEAVAPATGELAAVLPFDLLLVLGLARLAGWRRRGRPPRRRR